ncbi:MAG TPA: hypothetical protein VGM44_18840, partial [Polyangiaceae bacterium]|jgi:hypothetical protein
MYDYGELPLSELIQIYCETMFEVVFRGLDAMGVDTARGRAWLAARAPADVLASLERGSA